MLDQVASWLFDPAGLTPHGFCLLWDPGLIWLHALSDIGIGVAYFTIPLALAVFARRRRDLVFRPVFWLFAAFILLCGTGHLLDVLTLWVPAYWADGLVKAATAIVSIVTAVALWWLLPQALALPSPGQLRDANAALLASEERLRQAQKMEAVGQLTGGIAHDFNNMLQGIAGGLELMQRRIAQGRPEEAAGFVAVAQQSVTRAAGLTHRMLAFARRQALNPRPVEPDTLVRGIAELIQRTLGPGIELVLRLHDGVWTALCDANQLESALLNLAINARDAMPDGGTLTIATADRHVTAAELSGHDGGEPGDYVELSVADTGTGMTPDVAARAFEPFFTTKPIGQGSGLGLSQIYGFVSQSGGFVRLESAPGRGTTLRLYLPRHAQAVPGRTTTAVAAAPPADPQPVPTGTVLVVDDEPAVRGQIAEVLRDLGCTVIEADDGPAGLSIMQSDERVDVLVADVGLPGLNGRQLADAARVTRPALPVLLVTGYAGTALENMALPPGIEVISKPFVLEALTARVRAMLEASLVR
jgi:signal transduction histidine kinase/CheY-like chemotaxis protein